MIICVYKLTSFQDAHAGWHVQDSRTGVMNEWVFNTEAHPLKVAGDLV
jgi:hypothetical protein